MSLIGIRNVSKSFEGTGLVVPPLDLSIPAGQFISFLGPSGCGKSTLLRLIAGLETPDTGLIEGVSGLKVSFVFQDAMLLPWRTALENVRLPLELENTAKDDIDKRAREALKRVGLQDAFDRKPSQLSGGMKMRVSLARALVTNPLILLLDEPFAALDEITRFRLQEDLLRFWKGSAAQSGSIASPMTVIFVTHSMSEAAFLAERQIVFSNRPARVIADRQSTLESARAVDRGRQTRQSIEFLNDVSALQDLFRETGSDQPVASL